MTIVQGQSNDACHAEGTGIVLPALVTPQVPDRVLMMNNTRAPGAIFEGAFTPDMATALVPARDGKGKCRATGAFAGIPAGYAGSSTDDPLGQSLLPMLYHLDAADLAAGRPPCRRVLVVCGVGGRTIEQISRGAAPWAGSNGTFSIWNEKLLTMVARAAELGFKLFGQYSEIETFVTHHGLSAYAAGNTVADYKAKALQLRSDMRTYLPALPYMVAPSYTTPFLIGQVVSDLKGGGNNATLAWSEIAEENSDGATWIYAPMHGFPFNTNDTTGTASAHWTVKGTAAAAEYLGRARAAIHAGGVPTGCYIPKAAWSLAGNVITLTANVALTEDVTRFPLAHATQGGWKVRDPGGAVITGRALSGPQATITLDKPPTGSWTLEYGFENPSGITGGTTAGVAWTDGEVDMAGLAAQTPGAWGNLRATTGSYACAFAGGFVARDWLRPGRWGPGA